MRVVFRRTTTWVATLVARPALATLLIVLTAGLAQAQTAVYYSVGTNAADLKIATNVTIAAGTATFTVAQPDNVGVGDQLTYNGATVAYISGRTSSTVYTLTTATGAAPTPGGPWVVNSILRAFNTLRDASRDSDDGTHLGGNNLPALDIQLNWPCYNDGPDPSAVVEVRESGAETWTTDATRYIRIYTPTTTSEVGVSQRQDGRAGTGYRIAPTGPAGARFFNFIYVGTGNVRIEGLEIDGSGLTNAGNIRGIMVNRDVNPMDDVRISHNLIHDITNTTDYDGAGQADVWGIRIEDVDNATVWNNIIYNLTNGSLHANSDTTGIQSAGANGRTQYFYNNTVYNLDGGQRPVRGIFDFNITINAKNNYVGLMTSTTTKECYNGPFLNAAGDNYNVSSDGTASGTGSQTGQSVYASYFVSVGAGSEDLHLLNDSNTLWGSFGADLDSDPNLPVTDDIDRGARDFSLPDIGADEYGAQTAGSCPAPSLLFSDGFESGDLSAWDGSVTSTAGDSIVASTTQVYTGSYSAKAETDAINAHRAYVYTTFAGQTTVSARAHIYLEPGFAPTNFTEVMYFEDGVSSNIIDIEMASDMTLYMWNNVAGEPYSSGTMISTGVWHSLEMTAVINGANGEARMWLDGVLVVDETARNLGTNPIARFDAGHFFSDDPNPASILYVDDATVCAEPMSVPPAPTVNYRSIGTAPAYTTGDVTATLGSATVTGTGAWITATRGRGDHIDVNGSEYTILAVDSQTQLTLTSPAIASYTGPTYTISRQYTTLQTWEDCISDVTPPTCSFFQVASVDFVADDRNEVGIAYDDGAAFAEILIDDSITDAGHTITLTVDPGNRHLGRAGTGVVIDNVASINDAVRVRDNHVTVEWLEIKNSPALLDGIHVQNQTAPNKVVLRNHLVHNVGQFGIATGGADLSIDIYNNIIYEADRGIRLGTHDTGVVRILNNTVYNNVSGGIRALAGLANVVAQNNISHSNPPGNDFQVPTLDPASSNNLASDGTGTTHSTTGGIDSVPLSGASPRGVNFVSTVVGSEDLHITSASRAVGAAADLGSLFDVDIDGLARQSPWEIGADETYGVASPTNYRSIGTAPPYTTGNVTATLGSTIVTGTGAWVTANRGRGDHIDINGDEYTILAVDSQTQLTLTSPAIATYTGPTYTISRQYATLQAWEDCISFSPPASCSFFQVASANLVTDNRSEVGIAYEESAFTSAGAVPIVRIQGTTTDAFHDITLTADGVNRHFGIPGDGVVLDMLAEPGSNAVRIQDEFVTVEWLEVTGGAGMDAFEVSGMVSPSQVTLRYNLIHDTANGDGMQLRDADLSVDVYNNIIYGADKAIELNTAVPTSARILNNTIYDCDEGVFADDGVTGCTNCKFDSVLLQNNIAHTLTGPAYSVPSTSATGFATDASSTNLASDATGTTHSAAGGGINSVAYASMNFVSATDLHITSGSAAEDLAVNLSSIFWLDIDVGIRSTPWDIGADDILATTAVELVSFEALGLDGAVELSWETGSEIDNLGFQLYRSLSEGGPYERITGSLIPGLGSSPEGASYSYQDSSLTNGVTYYYKLEDIETTGKTELHGPVYATPHAGATSNNEGLRGFVWVSPDGKTV